MKATALDPERFEATFEEWSAMANEALAKMKSVGIVAQKVLINADDFRAWCQENDVANDAAARARFVSEHPK